jgi:hypothetical protein
MGTMKIERRHDLPDAEVRTRLEALGDYLHNKYKLDVSWSGDVANIRGRFMVVTIEGSIKLEPGKVVFEGKDPGMLWRGKAKGYLEHKLGKYLDPATPSDALPRS